MHSLSEFPLSTLADVERFERERAFDERCRARSVYDVFVESATRYPTHRAITMLMTGVPDEVPRTVTYAQLLEGITRTANFFSAIGGPRPGVAYMLPSLVETQFVLWGAEAVGYAVPINFLLAPEHIAHLLVSAKVRILVALGPHPQLNIWEKAVAAVRQVPSVKLVQVRFPDAVDSATDTLEFSAGIRLSPSDRLNFKCPGKDDDVAAFFHTGGTTGAPKLATHTHRNQIVAAFGTAALFDLRTTDIFTHNLPLFHVGGAIFGSLSHFMVGAQLLLMTPVGMRNPEIVRSFWRLVKQYGVTVIGAIPTVMSALLPVPVDADLSRVRLNISGAAAAPKVLLGQFEEHTGKRVHEIYGLTECGGAIAVSPAAGNPVAGSVGVRLPYTRTEVRQLGADGTLGSPCAAYEVGVLTVYGPTVTPGYVRSEDNDDSLSDAFINTQDLAYTDDDGRIFLVGRTRDLIIRSGHNIDPQQIEEAVLLHPAIAQAAAVGQPDRYAGELPVCYVVPKPNTAITVDELRAYAEPRISERPAWPKRYFIVEALPLTGVGKIFKPALRVDAVRRYVIQLLTDLVNVDVAEVSCENKGREGMQVMVRLPATHWGERARVEKALEGHLFSTSVVKA